MEPRPDSLQNINIEDEMQRSYLDYSMSVIVGRALPDARDGMKPGARRILFAMRELGLLHSRSYKKCAYVVGEVLGKYHPHGDSAVYETLVRMAQDFAMRYPLVDGQGNFGSIDGDNAAAYRYTECRLTKLAEELLTDTDKDTVDMVKNYNGELDEPSVLPARLPNLLMNGSTGIAVGMATNIPPHNLGELVDALVHLIDHPQATVDHLLQFVKGPDFPTGGLICGRGPILEMYRTGRGQLKVRGRATIEEGRGGKETILVTEIPYAVNKSALLERIAELVSDKIIEGISDLRDESNKEGIRIVIELKRGVIPKVVLNNLYKHTPLQTTFGANMLALDQNRPRLMTLRDLLQIFLAHRYEVVRRRTAFELAKAEARAHILEGLRIAIDHLDAVVRTIREARDRATAHAQLMQRFGLSEVQAHAILDMRLYQLTGLERDKVEAEYRTLVALIADLKALLASRDKLFGVIRGDLLEVKAAYGNPRLTEIVPDEGEVNVEDLIANRPSVITITHGGYIKRTAAEAYRAQRRGGKGVAGMETKEADYVEHLFIANAHDYLLFFTHGGRVYWEKVYEIPEAARTSRGKAIVNLLTLQEGETVAAMIRVQEFPEDQFLVMATEKGIIKKTTLGAFAHPRRDGIIALNVDEGDRLMGVRQTGGQDDLVLVTRKGMSIRFPEAELRELGRATRGVRAITLDEDDIVECLGIVEPEATLFVCTENGYGKRTAFDAYRDQHRGGRGILAIRASERNGVVVGAHAVTETDALMLITAQGKMIRMPVRDMRVISRVTQGVRLIDLDEGDRLVAATTVAPEEIDAEADADAPPASATPEAGP